MRAEKDTNPWSPSGSLILDPDLWFCWSFYHSRDFLVSLIITYQIKFESLVLQLVLFFHNISPVQTLDKFNWSSNRARSEKLLWCWLMQGALPFAFPPAKVAPMDRKLISPNSSFSPGHVGTKCITQQKYIFVEPLESKIWTGCVCQAICLAA